MADAVSLRAARDAQPRRAASQPGAVRAPGARWAGLGRAAQGWVLPLALLALWQGSSAAGLVPETLLPAPATVARTAWDSTRSGELGHNLSVSTARAAAGFLVGGGLGFAFGLANGLSERSFRFSDTTVQMVRNIPHLALIPLLIVWFGIGEGAKLVLVALGVFFPVYLNTLHGIRSVDPQLLEMGRSYGMGPATLFRRVLFPGALPSIFVGVRFGLGVMWLTLIVAETIAAQSGIGYMAMQAREFMQTDVVVMAILLYAVLGKLADVAAGLAERACLPWKAAR